MLLYLDPTKVTIMILLFIVVVQRINSKSKFSQKYLHLWWCISCIITKFNYHNHSYLILGDSSCLEPFVNELEDLILCQPFDETRKNQMNF